MAGTVGTYGVSDYSSWYVVRSLGASSGVTNLFVQGVLPDGSGVSTAGVQLSLRTIAPPTGSLGVGGNKPTLVDPGHPT